MNFLFNNNLIYFYFIIKYGINYYYFYILYIIIKLLPNIYR